MPLPSAGYGPEPPELMSRRDFTRGGLNSALDKGGVRSREVGVDTHVVMSASTRFQRPPSGRMDPRARSEPKAALVAALTDPRVLTCVTVVGLSALAGLVGADARWLAALGHRIASGGAIPTGVPFAAAPAAHWHNAVVLAELLFWWLEAALGDRGLMLAQLVAVAAVVLVLMRDARASGASMEGAGAAVLVAVLGGLASFTVARVQLFSLVLFVILAALLRSETRDPSRRIWLALPLIAVWANLHGGVLIGAGMLLGYLVLVRLRAQPLTAVAMIVVTPIALCLTPAGLGTIGYYHGLLSNQAAAQGQGLWAPLTLSAPLDVVLVIAALVLVVEALRRRPPIWELIIAAGLAVATIHASRSGIWLLLFLVVPAARSIKATRWWAWLMPPLAVAALVGLVFGLVRGPTPNGASPAIVNRAIAAAHGTPIVADDVIDEQIALAGGRIWVGNPIDAFTKHDQLTYLAWLDGRRAGLKAIGPDVSVVVTANHGKARSLMAHDAAFVRVATDGRSDLFVRTRGS